MNANYPLPVKQIHIMLKKWLNNFSAIFPRYKIRSCSSLQQSQEQLWKNGVNFLISLASPLKNFNCIFSFFLLFPKLNGHSCTAICIYTKLRRKKILSYDWLVDLERHKNKKINGYWMWIFLCCVVLLLKSNIEYICPENESGTDYFS